MTSGDRHENVLLSLLSRLDVKQPEGSGQRIEDVLVLQPDAAELCYRTAGFSTGITLHPSCHPSAKHKHLSDLGCEY